MTEREESILKFTEMLAVLVKEKKKIRDQIRSTMQRAKKELGLSPAGIILGMRVADTAARGKEAVLETAREVATVLVGVSANLALGNGTDKSVPLQDRVLMLLRDYPEGRTLAALSSEMSQYTTYKELSYVLSELKRKGLITNANKVWRAWPNPGTQKRKVSSVSRTSLTA